MMCVFVLRFSLCLCLRLCLACGRLVRTFVLVQNSCVREWPCTGVHMTAKYVDTWRDWSYAGNWEDWSE